MDKKVPCKVIKDSFCLELLRGIRYHFSDYLKNYLQSADVDQEFVFKAQRGLAHSYSRAKVKFNVNKSDNMIIQSISTLDTLDKDINTFAMRVRYSIMTIHLISYIIREWYSWHFPELIRIANDNILYARIVRLIGNREKVTDAAYEGILKITDDEEKSRLILRAAKTSAGYEISDYDMKLIQKYSTHPFSYSI
jgi:nucleolar protein 56